MKQQEILMLVVAFLCGLFFKQIINCVFPNLIEGNGDGPTPHIHTPSTQCYLDLVAGGADSEWAREYLRGGGSCQ